VRTAFGHGVPNGVGGESGIEASMRRARTVFVITLLATLAGSVLCFEPGCARNTSRTSPSVVPESAVGPTSEAWTFEGRTGTLIRTRSFRLFTTMQPGRVVDILPEFMEAALDGYTSALLPLPRPAKPMDAFLMRTRDEWVTLTQQVMGRDAAPYLKIPRGGLTSNGKALLFDVGRARDTLMLAAHEGWHQYTQSTFKDALPMWLEEGMATYMEGFRQDRADPTRFAFLPWANMERFFALREASRRGRIVNLETLLNSTPQDLMAENSNAALQYYAQVWALTHFLNDAENAKYRPALHQMIKDAADGTLTATIRAMRGGRAASSFAARRRGVDPLLTYIDMDLDVLNKQYQDYVAWIVAPGNERVVSQGKVPGSEP